MHGRSRVGSSNGGHHGFHNIIVPLFVPSRKPPFPRADGAASGGGARQVGPAGAIVASKPKDASNLLGKVNFGRVRAEGPQS
jgi:hypothetical protein